MQEFFQNIDTGLVSVIVPPLIMIAAFGLLTLFFVKRVQKVVDHNQLEKDIVDSQKQEKLARSDAYLMRGLAKRLQSLRGHTAQLAGGATRAATQATQRALPRSSNATAQKGPTRRVEIKDGAAVEQQDLAAEAAAQGAQQAVTYTMPINVAEITDPQEKALVNQLVQDPQNILAYEQLGDYYIEQQKYADARECYKQILRLDPRHRRGQEVMKRLDQVLG